MQTQFELQVNREGDIAVITVSGELDLATSPTLERELERADATSTSVLIVDLRRVEFMDSTGLSVLVRAQQRSEQNGRRFGIAGGSPQVQRLLSLTGVDEKFTLVETPEELLEQG